MISNIIIPDLGATGDDVTLTEWLVRPGDQVQAGQPLFVVETDKATVEVESFRDGMVRELLVEARTAVPLGTVVAVLADSMDEPLAGEPAASPKSPGPTLGLAGITRPMEPAVPDGDSGDRLLTSPLARRMAQAEGIDLASLKGSGRQGQILKRDVERALAPTREPTGPLIPSRRETITPMRRAIAGRTRRSKNEAPHFYANITVDMSEALGLRREAAGWAANKGWAAPTITDLCLRATALTLPDFPSLNASIQGEEIVYYESINIGLVVGLEEGMLVPVVREADRHNLYTLAAITRRLKQRAEKGTLSSSELSGGTFSLSNLGMYGLDSFTAVINPPQAGILALGAVRELPAVHGGAVVVRSLMTAVLSVDHRLVDGIVAARFLTAWKELLESPFRLTLDPPEEINL